MSRVVPVAPRFDDRDPLSRFSNVKCTRSPRWCVVPSPSATNHTSTETNMRSKLFPAALALALLAGTAAVSAQTTTTSPAADVPAVKSDKATTGDSSNTGQKQESERRDVSPGNTGAATDATSGAAPTRQDPGATGQKRQE
jgi:hypothetical protein